MTIAADWIRAEQRKAREKAALVRILLAAVEQALNTPRNPSVVYLEDYRKRVGE